MCQAKAQFKPERGVNLGISSGGHQQSKQPIIDTHYFLIPRLSCETLNTII